MKKRFAVMSKNIQWEKILSPKVMLYLAPTVIFLSGCGGGPAPDVPVKVSMRFELDELGELPPVHNIHRGKKMTADMKPTPQTLECHLCHGEDVAKTRKQIPSMSVCQSCHTGEIAPDLPCKRCHIGTKKVLDGIGGINVDDTVSQMADVDCEDCHDSENEYQVSSEACLDCHEEELLEKKARLQKEHAEKVVTVGNYYKEIGDYIKSANGKSNTFINHDEFKKGEYNYKLALLDRSGGIHNTEFTKQLLGRAEKTLAKLDKQYNDKMLQLLQQAKAEDPTTRMKALGTLGEIGGEISRGALIEALKDPAANVRQKVVGILGKTRDKKFLDALILALRDKDPRIRQEVVKVLGKIRSKKAIDALNRAAYDSDSGVRWRANAILKNLKAPAHSNNNSANKWNMQN
jgi:hypothetical protein